jgi:transcriptional repressor NrdR
MHCPFCQNDDTRVIDTRVVEEGMAIRRRRECGQCGERYNTYETAELKMPVMVKSNDRREAFDEKKLRTSFERAVQKRPVSSEQIDAAVHAIMHRLMRHVDRELSSRQLGILVMDELKKMDQVAYVRFASVYRKFQDVEEFKEVIERLERDMPGLAEAQLPLLDPNLKP